jgi:hypothetical protein
VLDEVRLLWLDAEGDKGGRELSGHSKRYDSHVLGVKTFSHSHFALKADSVPGDYGNSSPDEESMNFSSSVEALCEK